MTEGSKVDRASQDFNFDGFSDHLKSWIWRSITSDGSGNGVESPQLIKSAGEKIALLPSLIENKQFDEFFQIIDLFAIIRKNSIYCHVEPAGTNQLHELVGQTIVKQKDSLIKHLTGPGRAVQLASLTSYIHECPEIVQILEKNGEKILKAGRDDAEYAYHHEGVEFKLLIALADYGSPEWQAKAKAKLRELVPVTITDLIEPNKKSNGNHKKTTYLNDLFDNDQYVSFDAPSGKSRVAYNILSEFYASVGVNFDTLEKEVLSSRKPRKRLDTIRRELGAHVSLYGNSQEQYQLLLSNDEYLTDIEDNPDHGKAFLDLEQLGFSVEQMMTIVKEKQRISHKSNKEFVFSHSIEWDLVYQGKKFDKESPGIVHALYEKYKITDFKNMNTDLINFLLSNPYNEEYAQVITDAQLPTGESASALEALHYLCFGLSNKQAQDIVSWGNKVNIIRGIQRDMKELNLSTCKELFAIDPNAPKVLYDVFGIRDFGRHSVEYLSNLYQNIDDLETSYVTMIIPQADNGERMTFVGRSEKLFQSLPKTHLLRVIEGASKQEIIDRIKALDAKYNQDSSNQIQHLVLTGHGTKESVSISLTEEWGIADFQENGVASEMLRLLHNRASVLVTACNGEEIGRVIRKSSGLKVIAADHSVCVSGFRIVDDSEGEISYIDLLFSSTGKLVRLGIQQDPELLAA